MVVVGFEKMSSLEPRETVQSRARMEALINSAFKREVIRKVTGVILPLNDIGSGPSFYSSTLSEVELLSFS